MWLPRLKLIVGFARKEGCEEAACQYDEFKQAPVSPRQQFVTVQMGVSRESYSNMSANANSRRTLLKEVDRWDLADETFSSGCSLCTTGCLQPEKYADDTMFSAHRHLQEGREVRCSKEESSSGREMVVTVSVLDASDRTADGSLYDPSSKSGLLTKDCSCVKKGTRSKSGVDSGLRAVFGLLRKTRMPVVDI